MSSSGVGSGSGSVSISVTSKFFTTSFPASSFTYIVYVPFWFNENFASAVFSPFVKFSSIPLFSKYSVSRIPPSTFAISICDLSSTIFAVIFTLLFSLSIILENVISGGCVSSSGVGSGSGSGFGSSGVSILVISISFTVSFPELSIA